jgi:Tol biopolymer transport system component
MIEVLVKDARFAIRGLQKQPAFTFAAVMALALGIGATTTIFSVIQNVLLDPYPMYADVDRIVGIQIRDLASARPGGREWYPVAEFLDYQTQAQSFDEVIAGTGEHVVYSSSAGSEQFLGGLTTGNTFNVMGVRAAIGRTLTPEDARPGAPPVFVLSYKLWATRFGLDKEMAIRAALGASRGSTAPQALALSPDGGTLAFVASLGGQSRLWLRSLASGSSHALADTDGADAPFWSPDSRAIGFFADGKLRRVEVDGGSVQTITNAFGTGGGTWNRDNVILFASLGRPITRVGAIGGAPVELTGLTQLGSDFSPFFLPDGRHFLYYVRGNPEVRGVYVGDIDQQMETRRLLDADSSAVYAATGQLLFARHSTLSAQNFDAATLQLSGASFPVAGVRGAQYGPTQFGPSVSAAGSVAFRSSAAPGKRELVWFDRSGKQIGTVGDGAGDGSQPSLTRDGAHVAMYRGVNGNVDVWSLDTKRGAWSRVTSDPADDVFPVWSPDGSELVFSSNRTGIHNLYRRPLTAGGREERLFSSPQHKVATDWSADGRFIVFDSEDPKTGSDIWALPLDGKEKPFPVVNTKFDEHSAQFSPDGHWIAYQSNESGRTEIYVQPFPGPGNSSVISTAGGTQAHWGRDAKELFYVARDGRLTVVPIRLTAKGQAPDVGAGVPLFAPPLGRAVE